MTDQANLGLDDRRIGWLPAWRAKRLGVKPLSGILTEREGSIPVEPEVEARLMRGPRACAAGVTLPPVRPLEVGAADRARIVLGLGGEWPSPVPGQYSEEEE